MKYSVVICTFNGEKYIKEQLNSIVEQTLPVSEIIVCDDGSTDSTVSLCNSILEESDIEYRIIINTQHKGVAANFINGMKLARNEYIFTCDQDDIWCKDKVEIFDRFVAKRKKELYFSNGYLIDSHESLMENDLWQSFGFNYEKLNEAESLFRLMLKRGVVTGSAMAVSSRLVERVNYIPTKLLHDAWLSWMAITVDSICPINERTYYYRQHSNNVMGAGKQRSAFRMIKDYIANVEKVKSTRDEKVLKLQEILKIDMDTQMRNEVEKCYSFWRDLDTISDRGLFDQVKTILSHWKAGNYRLYYSGSKGAVRDIISLFVR